MADKNIIIYHTTDMHNRKKAFSYLKSIDKKSDNVILLDSGDAILGSSTICLKKESILDEMQKYGYTAMSVGNREFHYLRNVFEARANQTNIPFISANLLDMNGGDFIKPFIIKDVNGVKVGITGITPIQYGKCSFLKKISRFDFLDYKEALEKVFEKLKGKADIIIVLAHLEFKKVEALAKLFPQPLLFLGGHDHRVSFKPVKANDSYIFYSGCYGGYVTKINLKIKDKSSGGKFEIEENEVIEIN